MTEVEMKREQRMRLWAAALSVCMAAGMAQPAMAGVVKKSAAQTSGSAANNTAEAATAQTDFYFAGQEMYTYQRMEADIQLLKARYEGVTVDSIGTTVDGRNIYRIVIGNPNADKKMLVLASIHAREYITTPLVMRQIQEMLDRKANGETALNEVCIQFVPMANPDGVEISQRALNGLTKDSSKQSVRRIIESWSDWGLLENQDKYNWYLNKWKNNVNGVDLNHNFPTPGWAQLNDNRGKASSEFYKGPSAASEPETQAIIKLVNEQKFSQVLNYHAQGQIIYWSQMHAAKEVLEKDKAMGLIAARRTGYALVDPSADGSRYGAGFKDWLDWEKGIPNITLEVGLGVSPVPENQIEKIWQQNKGLLPELVNYLLGRSGESISSGNAKSESKANGAAKDDGVRYISPKGSGDADESLTPPGVE